MSRQGKVGVPKHYGRAERQRPSVHARLRRLDDRQFGSGHALQH
jgi:hypothetical protein